MLIDEFLEPRIHIVSGKGGVGKTTVSAAVALVAARHGRKVCIAEVDHKGALPHLFGASELTYEPHELSPDVWGINIQPDRALREYLEVQYHMRRLSWVFTSTHFVDYITTAAPGLKDILVLGKIWYLEQGRGTHHDFDTIVVDAPAAGHMLTFLSAPSGLSDAVRMGPVRRQAEWLVQMLCDPHRTRVELVSLPEEMPVAETIETSRALAERLGIAQGVVFANAVYGEVLPEDDAALLDRLAAEDRLEELRDRGRAAGIELHPDDIAALLSYGRFSAARRAIQARYLGSLRDALELPVVELPFLFSAGLALPDIESLADAIEENVAKL